jgi:hypothetical protein
VDHVVTLLVEALCYRAKGRWIDSLEVTELSVDLILPASLWLWRRLSF